MEGGGHAIRRHGPRGVDHDQEVARLHSRTGARCEPCPCFVFWRAGRARLCRAVFVKAATRTWLVNGSVPWFAVPIHRVARKFRIEFASAIYQVMKRGTAAEQGVSEAEALEKGLEAKLKEFVGKGRGGVRGGVIPGARLGPQDQPQRVRVEGRFHSLSRAPRGEAAAARASPIAAVGKGAPRPAFGARLCLQDPPRPRGVVGPRGHWKDL